MVIRKMTEQDLEAVCEIENKIFSMPWSKKDFETSLVNGDNIYLVVLIEKEIVAYCGLWGVLGEGQINNVAVKEQYRNQKIGYKMLSELIDMGKKNRLKQFTLEVRKSNHFAIRLYEQLGFYCEGIRKGFYDTPKEDALIMWLK